MNERDEICSLWVSRARHTFGMVVLLGLGFIVLILTFNQTPDDPFWLLFLIGLVVSAFYMAMRFWQAASVGMILREDGVYLNDGTLLCALDQVKSVERGAFAFKPSNGFLIRLKDRAPFAWVPGLYWRSGRMIGVGGITPAAQGKLMADMMAAMIAGR